MVVKLHKYQHNFGEVFEKEKIRILGEIGGIEIFHIGSTGINGITGKGIIDMMMVPENWEKRLEIVERLKNIGYEHVHPEEKGRIFVSTKAETGKGDFHIHIVKKDSRDYKELLFFVKFLNENEWARREYEKIKLSAKEMERKDYGKRKGEFIKKILSYL